MSTIYGYVLQVLMRSFWFLFPVANYDTLPLEAVDDENKLEPSCFGCDAQFPSVSTVSVLHSDPDK